MRQQMTVHEARKLVKDNVFIWNVIDNLDLIIRAAAIAGKDSLVQEYETNNGALSEMWEENIVNSLKSRGFEASAQRSTTFDKTIKLEVKWS